jgi:hypothetical protein
LVATSFQPSGCLTDRYIDKESCVKPFVHVFVRRFGNAVGALLFSLQKPSVFLVYDGLAFSKLP